MLSLSMRRATPRIRCAQVAWRSYVRTVAPYSSSPSMPRSTSSSSSSRFSSSAAAAAAETSIQVTDPLLLYHGMVANGTVKSDPEQIRALVQMRKLTEELLDYSPPVRLLTLLESLRPTNDPLAFQIPEWPFRRSPLSSRGIELSEDEEAERSSLLSMSEKEKSTALVKVLKDDQGLEGLDTPKGFLLTGPPGTGKSFLVDLFFASLPVPHKVRFHYHSFLLFIYSAVHQALEKQRVEFELEERRMNELADQGDGTAGYPWSRREEMKALALSKGWRAVFAGGRSPKDHDLNTREFVLAGVARDLIKTYGWLLAFDEVQLVDIAGAGLLNRVISWYWRLGGVVVGTSNRLPQGECSVLRGVVARTITLIRLTRACSPTRLDLYNSGVQKESLSPFLLALAARSPVLELRSATDYRREQHGKDALDGTNDREPGDFGQVEAWQRWGSAAKGWFVKGQEAEFQDAVERIVGNNEGKPTSMKVYGRNVVIPWAVGGVARFSFSELCEKALGPADFISLGSQFHTLILTDVPVLLLSQKNEARRLITLLDALYESKTRLLAFASAQVDDLFFPDALRAIANDDESGSAPQSEYTQPSPDDITTSSGSNHPFSSERIYEADGTISDPSSSRGMDAAAEIGDSLTQEMIGDVIQDLEAPYRPNVSSYDESKGQTMYEQDEARIEHQRDAAAEAKQHRQRSSETKEEPHPTASPPSFRNLAIFTGEEERFAFKRAVSRVHEMSSTEYLVTAQHAPLDPRFRTWERPGQIESSVEGVRRMGRDARHVLGAKEEIEADESTLSGAISPSQLRVRHPEGLPKHPTVEVERTTAKGTKYDILNIEDTRREVPPPVFKDVHVWGVREFEAHAHRTCLSAQDWGKAAGKWGQGASAHEKKEGEDKK
ncbi:BZ3500_MvSof-1268-A1-R1_Chr1-2g01361 [Microbotryum saponariae]|uniref:BZ3500_MvSof-1268-A1-R1_Chr1-2g01361 protein n=1 Tax=Microbotryum saponariae TaxID=289078 RepID=A0A2X0MH20_9BASI|nr:BZ3500_MvSof-1268-A1-R1_Chr1-2g01361 [Microbotryum saponariae]SCZ97207.1 BZ3501_MvSof-1269-A2-R1_Chr1-2g00960 [Microbotryum saponariae]